jgi:hypothetical protein
MVTARPSSAGRPPKGPVCAPSTPSTSPSNLRAGSPTGLRPTLRPTGRGRSRSSSPRRSRRGCSAGRPGWSPRPTGTAGPGRPSPSSTGRSARSAWTRPSGPPGAGPPGRPGPAPCSRPATFTCWGRPATGRPWPCTPGASWPGQPAVLQAGPRREELPPLPEVAGGRVVVGAPSRPSGSALVVGVVAGAWLVRRRTARWILATSGMG